MFLKSIISNDEKDQEEDEELVLVVVVMKKAASKTGSKTFEGYLQFFIQKKKCRT